MSGEKNTTRYPFRKDTAHVAKALFFFVRGITARALSFRRKRNDNDDDGKRTRLHKPMSSTTKIFFDVLFLLCSAWWRCFIFSSSCNLFCCCLFLAAVDALRPEAERPESSSNEGKRPCSLSFSKAAVT